MSLFQLTSLSRIFTTGRRQVIALDSVSLTINPGDRLGVVGESGSGKSTLARQLVALDRPTSGEVHFDGRRIDHLREPALGELRSRVQFVFQDPRSSLNPRMKVRDIIVEPLRSPLLRARSDVPHDHPARLAEVLHQVGLPADSADRYPHEFSGGQRQRIAIARALAARPEVLVADEPVSALDVSVRSQVINLLNDLVDDMSLTIVVVTHDFAVVRELCDWVAVLRHGRIVEHGPTEKILTRPEHDYTRLLLESVPRVPDL